MKFKKIIILVGVFILSFIVFNLLPLIPIQYDVGELTVFGHPTEKVCSLNYLTCLSSRFGDNFPSLLTNEIFFLFIFPILIPVIFTVGSYYLFLREKHRKKKRK